MLHHSAWLLAFYGCDGRQAVVVTGVHQPVFVNLICDGDGACVSCVMHVDSSSSIFIIFGTTAKTAVYVYNMNRSLHMFTCAGVIVSMSGWGYGSFLSFFFLWKIKWCEFATFRTCMQTEQADKPRTLHIPSKRLLKMKMMFLLPLVTIVTLTVRRCLPSDLKLYA